MSEEIKSNTTVEQEYGADQIQILEGLEAVRKRPGMYIGTTSSRGLHHLVYEIVDNAVDEALAGYCDTIDVTINEDNSITVVDNGRGVPFGKAEDGSETLVNVYTKLHTGAKFDSNGKTGYNTSGGMNGVGAKATNALSTSFMVTSIRGGKCAIAHFKKGELESYKEEAFDKNVHGTCIRFLPDNIIFKEGIHLEYDSLKKQIQELAYLSPGMTFNLKFEDKDEEVITSQNGIKDYINDLNNKRNTLTSVFYTESMEDRIGVKLAMQYNDTYTDVYKLYTNSIPNSAGTHLTGFRTALTQSINEYARDKKYLKEKERILVDKKIIPINSHISNSSYNLYIISSILSVS